jgi:hypothetical protein
VITFKQFLSLGEAIIKPWEQFSVETEKAVGMLNSSHRDGLKAITTGGLLFRGFKELGVERGSMAIVDPSKGERTSRDSNNMYQLAMDRSAALKDYPSRSKALICSTSAYDARHYGTPYVIVPVDGTKIAVSQSEDFATETFMKGSFTSSVESFSTLLRRVAEQLKIDHRGDGKFTDADALNRVFDSKTPEEIAEAFDSYSYCVISKEDLIDFFEKHKKNRFDAIATFSFTPATISTRLVEYGENLEPIYDYECWLSARCMAIPCPMFGDILNRLKEQSFPIHAKYKTMMENGIFPKMIGRQE